jgi:hypothetical protein
VGGEKVKDVAVKKLIFMMKIYRRREEGKNVEEHPACVELLILWIMFALKYGWMEFNGA